MTGNEEENKESTRSGQRFNPQTTEAPWNIALFTILQLSDSRGDWLPFNSRFYMKKTCYKLIKYNTVWKIELF